MTADDFIGKEFIKKYNYIYPILRLIYYRLDIRGKEGLFTYDFAYDKPIGIHDIIRYIPKRFLCLKHTKHCNSCDKEAIFVSDTFLCLDRYDNVLDEILSNDTYNIKASLITKEAFRSNNELTGLEKKRWDRKKIYFGDSISGKRVIKTVDRLFDLFLYIIHKGESLNDHFDEVDRLLQELENNVKHRIRTISRIFINNKIKLFITINQYNLRDLLMIMACRSLGIKSKQMMHSTICTDNLNKRKDVDEDWFSYVDENAYWCHADVEYVKRRQQIIHNCFGDETKLTVVGCPEITENDLGKIDKSNRNDIILFVPEYEIKTGVLWNSDPNEELIR